MHLFGGTSLVLAFTALALWRDRVRLAAERDLLAARLEDRAAEGERMEETFRALATDALRDSGRELVGPLERGLRATQERLATFERDNDRMRSSLLAQVRMMSATGRSLRKETERLVTSLRRPNVRGRYGEVQLERIVELAGMRPWCDFTTQKEVRDERGRTQRPDLVVHLPGGREIAVDAKMPLEGYLDAIDCEDEEEAAPRLERFAADLARQVRELSGREYWRALDRSPELVVLFLPGDQLVDAALARRPTLFEEAATRGVVLASPSSLLGILRAVHLGWQEQGVASRAAELLSVARDLRRRCLESVRRAGEVERALTNAQRQRTALTQELQEGVLPSLDRLLATGGEGRATVRPRAQRSSGAKVRGD